MNGPRAQAIAVLKERTERGTALDILFQSPRFSELSARDRSFVKELVYGVFRNLSLLDYLISQRSQRPLDRIDQVVLWILRLSLYQIDFLRVPDYAAVHEAGDLCGEFRKYSARSFVNGVLRAFLRNKPSLPTDLSASSLATRYSHPEWLVLRYLSRYGAELTEKALKLNNETPQSILWINTFKTTLAEFRRNLKQEGISYQMLPDIPSAVKVEAARFTEHWLYEEGHCFFMDASSQKIAQLPDLSTSRLVGDLCAAPGGKSFLMAARLNPGGRIFCSDVDDERLRQVRRRAHLYGITGLYFVQMDLIRRAACSDQFDAVLVDVPCSGTGTLRSNPDARWRIEESDLLRHQDRQLSLLRNAFVLLLPGRELVYSTCSTEPEENENVVERFLAAEGSAELAGDYFRTFPYQEQGEGFFAARVRRV